MAAARAEARRKAILSRGTDRLAKLTTSARGDDPAYVHDDPPLPSMRSGMGEESHLPPPASRTPSPSPLAAAGLGGPSPDPSVWSEEQQRQFLRALMGENPSTPSPGVESLGLGDDPFAALLKFSQFENSQRAPDASGKVPAAGSPQSHTRTQKLMPLFHLVAIWCLLGYFVLSREPQVFQNETHGAVRSEGRWTRWAELGRRNATKEGGWGVQFLPFFWAFTTLQIILYSLRIFSGFDKVQPPMLISLVLPHLPPPFPLIILNFLKYFQMGGLFLDDVAGLVVGIGFLVLFAGWSVV